MMKILNKYSKALVKNLVVEMVVFILILLLFRDVRLSNFNYEIFFAMMIIFNLMLVISVFFNTTTFMPTGATAHAKFWTKYLDNDKDATHEVEMVDFWGATAPSKSKDGLFAALVNIIAILINVIMYAVYIAIII